MSKVYVVTKDTKNDLTYEDNICNLCEYVGVFGSWQSVYDWLDRYIADTNEANDEFESRIYDKPIEKGRYEYHQNAIYYDVAELNYYSYGMMTETIVVYETEIM